MNLREWIGGELPKGWTLSSIYENVIARSGNSTLIKGKLSQQAEKNLYPAFSASGQDVWTEHFEHEGNGIVVSAVGARCGKSFLAHGRWTAIANTHTVIPNQEAIDIKFLWYALNDEEFWIRSGSAQPFVVVKKSLERIFAFPPRTEQTRIVAKLEELLSDLDAGVAELKAAQKKLAQYRQSLLKAAVEGSLTAEWRKQQRDNGTPQESGADLLARILRERRARWEAKQTLKFAEQGKSPPKDWQKKYPEPATPATTNLPDLPEGWVWATVDQCALDELSITDGPFGSNLKSSHYQDSGPRVIRLQNIGDGEFHDVKAHISQEHYDALTKHAVLADDVVVAMLGEVLPRACLIPEGVSPAIVKADCARVRLNQSLLSPRLLVAQLNSKPIRDIVVNFVKGIGRPRVNLGHIRAIPIALAGKPEQLEMLSLLQLTQQAIYEQNQAIELSLKQSAAQRQNILRAAFAGQLVPQDPSDEPAAALLARIRASRDAATPAKRTRKVKETA